MTGASRIGRLLRQPGGLSAAQAVAAAQAQLAVAGHESLARVDELLQQMQISGSERAHAGPLSVRVDEVAGLAGLCDLPALAGAAYSLRELIDRCTRAGRWNSDAVSAHLDSMRAIRMCADNAESAVAALRSLVDRVTRR